MARTRSISSIEAEISKVEAELTRVRQKAESLEEQLLKLKQQKSDYETKQVMDAFRKSGKSLTELMTFLDV